MRLMLAALLILSGAWAAYWWFGSSAEEERIAAWLGDNSSITHGTQIMRGFPNRHDTTLDPLTPDAGSLLWTLPPPQLFRLSYPPGHSVVSCAPGPSLTPGATEVRL